VCLAHFNPARDERSRKCAKWMPKKILVSAVRVYSQLRYWFKITEYFEVFIKKVA
jgi:hypothetical protein